MKILLVITRADSIGGAQLHVRDLARRLTDDGHDVLVATGVRGALSDMLDERGIPTVECTHLQRSLHPVRDARAVRSLSRIIRAFQPDLVAAHSSKAGIVARLASRLVGVPCVFTAHGWAFAEGVGQPSRTLWRMVERAAERLATRIICVSEFDRNRAIGFGFSADRLVAIHYGIAGDIPPPVAHDHRDTQVRMVMVARFSHQKDHRTLLQAVQAVPGCTLDLVGDGPLQPEMEALAETLGIRDRVRFHGYSPDVAGMLGRADIYVMTSHYEGFPLATLEAMQAGLPVVISDVDGAGEAVTDGVTGYVVPRSDVATLRQRLRILVDQPGLRRQMGQSAQESFARSFTFDRMYDATLAVYQEAAAAHGFAPRPARRPWRPAALFANASHLWRSTWD